MKSSVNGDLLFISAVTLVFSACGTLLARDLFFTGGFRQGQQIGVIEYKTKFAEHRQSGSAVWRPLTADAPVYNRDTIRTGGESSATITLFDSTKIHLDEQSLVYLNLESEKQSVQLERGSVQLEAAPESDSPIALNTASGNISLTSGTLRVRETAGGLLIKPETAAVSFSSGDSGEIRSIESAVYLETETSALTPLALSVESPRPEATFVTVLPAADIVFAFSGQASETNVLAISTRRDMSAPLHEIRPKTPSLTIPLPEGRYYWKVSGTYEEGSFTVIRGARPEQLVPNGKRYYSAEGTTSVQLAWKKIPTAESYRVRLYSQTDESTPIQDRLVLQKNALIDIAEPGEYFWTVSALYGPDKVPFVSERASFMVEKKELTAPTTAQQGQSATISPVQLAEGKPILTWEPVPGAKAYDAYVSADPQGNNKIAESATRTNQLTLSEPLPSGSYYVHVRSRSGATVSEWSQPVTITVSPIARLTAQTPFNGETVQPDRKKITLSWSDPNKGSRYAVYVSRLSTFSETVVTATTSKNEYLYTLNPSESGTYYWKAQLLDKKGGIVSETETMSFVSPKTIPAPSRLSPTGKTFDLNALEPITFSWNGPDDAVS